MDATDQVWRKSILYSSNVISTGSPYVHLNKKWVDAWMLQLGEISRSHCGFMNQQGFQVTSHVYKHHNDLFRDLHAPLLQFWYSQNYIYKPSPWPSG